MYYTSGEINFKAERVGMAWVGFVITFGSQRSMSIEGMGGALLKGPGENTAYYIIPARLVL